MVSRLAATFAPFCRGGPWPSRGCLRRRGAAPGWDKLRPYEQNLCCAPLGWPQAPPRNLPPLSKGGGRAARRGRRDCPAPKCRPRKRPLPAKYPPCAAFRERLPASKQSPSLRLSPQPAPFDKGAKPTRGCSRRRNFPVCRRGFPCPVGRAFTPAAPRQFQNWNVPAAAGCGGMGHPALRSFYMLRAHRRNRCAPDVCRAPPSPRFSPAARPRQPL